MNICLPLLMVLLYHVELASVIQMFVVMSEEEEEKDSLLL